MPESPETVATVPFKNCATAPHNRTSRQQTYVHEGWKLSNRLDDVEVRASISLLHWPGKQQRAAATLGTTAVHALHERDFEEYVARSAELHVQGGRVLRAEEGVRRVAFRVPMLIHARECVSKTSLCKVHAVRALTENLLYVR